MIFISFSIVNLSTAFYKEIIEEKVDIATIKCPYLLERCILMVLNSVSHIKKCEKLKNSKNMKNFNLSENNGDRIVPNTLKIDKEQGAFSSYKELKQQNSYHSNNNKNQTQSNSWAQITWGSVNVPSTVSTPSSIDSGLQSVWLTLRFIRGVPNEVLSTMSDRLGAGVISILR